MTAARTATPRPQRGRAAADGAAAPARAGASAAHARATAPTCCSTACRGSRARRRSTTRSPQALRDHGVEVLHLRRCSSRRSTCRRPGRRPSRPPSRRPSSGRRWRRVLRAWLLDLPSDELARVLAAGLTHEELPRTGAEGVVARLAGAGDFVVPPAAEPAVHPRLLGLGRRPRRDHQPVDARPPARDRADRRDLPPPPALRRHAAALRRRREEAWFEGGDVLLLAAGRRRRRRRAAHHAGRRRGVRAARLRRPASRTPCSPSRSRRSGRRCTSTPSARWSTSTRS